METKKILIYGAVILITLLLLLSSLGVISFGGISQFTGSSTSDGGMPEKCRLPAGQDIDSWKEHLGHHAETKECLKYFK